MNKRHSAGFCKNIFNVTGQQSIEYILLFVAVIVVMIGAISSSGIFTRSIDGSLDKSVSALEGYAEGRVCFKDQQEAAWGSDGCCPSGCCSFPIPENAGQNCN